MPINGEFGKILKKRRLLECLGKDKFREEGRCLVRAMEIRKECGVHMQPYKCTFCGFFHLGHGKEDRMIEKVEGIR
jgi:hypothetical protein